MESCPPPARRRELEAGVRARYRRVAATPQGEFPYPVGREGAERLGYEAAWIEAVPARAVDRFVGVGNPFRVHRPGPGDRVLDAGCGAGFDSFIAATLVGPGGRVEGIDLTPEMLPERPWPARLGFRGGSIEDLPFADGCFDVVITNGVLNLIPDKDAAFRELRRVLRPGGVLAAADLVVIASIPPEVLEREDAWSG